MSVCVCTQVVVYVFWVGLLAPLKKKKMPSRNNNNNKQKQKALLRDYNWM